MTDPSTSPSPGQVANQIAAAMVGNEPVVPLGHAVARDDAGKPLYLVALVLGESNIDEFEAALTKLAPHMKPVENPQENQC